MTDFDYQWKNLSSRDIECNEDRVNEFLKFTQIDPNKIIRDKYCLDIGCGNGRYTYVMKKFGAYKVDSFDISSEAVTKCKMVNPLAYVFDIINLQPNPIYDFVLCWGVLNHVVEPRKAFCKVMTQVKRGGGILHIMVYHKDMQYPYEEGRKIWRNLLLEERLKLCEKKSSNLAALCMGGLMLLIRIIIGVLLKKK